MEENSIFPQGLVVMLEEALYHPDYTARQQPENRFYDTIRALGADEFLIQLEDMEHFFPKLAAYREQLQEEGEWKAWELLNELYGIPMHCHKIFHISMGEGQDNYVFVYDSGGATDPIFSVLLTEHVGDEFVYIGQFDLQNYNTGYVIQYEGEFYYIYLQNNDFSGFSDGIKWISLTVVCRFIFVKK